MTTTDLDDLMDKAQWLIAKATPNGECLEAHTSTDKDGYCQISVTVNGRHRNMRAHRLVYAQLVCDPGEMLVLHTCDNRKCIKPNHLYHGTQKQNIHDMISRGRKPSMVGVHRALNEEAVNDIRITYARGGVSQRSLAEKYNVDQSTISRIITGDRGIYTQ